MAIENVCYLMGQVHDKPKIYKYEERDISARLNLEVIRKVKGQNSEREGSLVMDLPDIYTNKQEIIDIYKQLDKGDFLFVKGHITSRDTTLNIACPCCEEKNKIKRVLVFVTPLFIERFKPSLNDTDGFNELRNKIEVSNNVFLIGTLCNDPHYYIDDKGRKYAQYLLGINRKIKIEDPTESEADYIWVKSYGFQAYNDKERLYTGSSVMVNGCIQTRTNISVNYKCEYCGEYFEKENNAFEIVASSVEYLNDFISGELDLDKIYEHEENFVHEGKSFEGDD